MATPELQLREIERSAELVRVVHYGCESWYNVKERPVAVSSVTFVEVCSHRETTFSMTDAQEDAEIALLRRYFDHLRAKPDAILVHWNMNSSDFGFQAIENRFRYATKEAAPYSPPAERLVDLDDLIGWRYGPCYAGHPKLYTMASLNGFNKRHILSGKDEADKFDKKEFGDIKRSTAEKAHLIAFLLRKLLDGSLETKSSGPFVAFAGARVNPVEIVLTVAERFRDVSRQLLRRHASRPTLEINDEYDFQDLFHSLLRTFFGDVRAEEWTPGYAGGCNRMDFLLPEVRLAVELKHGRASLDAKKLGEELLIDAQKYAKHPDVRHLICVVFDPQGHAQNPRGIERDLTGTREGLSVTVKIIDR